MHEARLIEVSRYPTGTKLAGIICVHQIFKLFKETHTWNEWLNGNMEKLKELLGDVTLKNLVLMTRGWREIHPATREQVKRIFSTGGEEFQYRTARAEGAQVYHCDSASELDLGALRIILGARPVVPKVQQEPINKGSESEQTAVAAELGEIPELARRHNSDTKKRGGGMQEAEDKRVEKLRREVEQERRRAREEADGLKKRIAEMQLEERMRKETCQELEERERRAREEADGLRKRIAEMQSKLEEDRHTSGKASATYLNSRHIPSHPICKHSSLDRALT